MPLSDNLRGAVRMPRTNSEAVPYNYEQEYTMDDHEFRENGLLGTIDNRIAKLETDLLHLRKAKKMIEQDPDIVEMCKILAKIGFGPV